MIRFRAVAAIVASLPALAAGPVAAQDQMTVGVFPVSSSLPYLVALERGFFKEHGVEPEMVRLIGGPPSVAAMITNRIEGSVVLVALRVRAAVLLAFARQMT
jgi:NitT/TauT family transport system substrate-binding protein